MGIREEIEKLKMGSHRLGYPGGEDAALVYEIMRGHRNETIEIVLSILDEHLGECVEGGRVNHITSGDAIVLDSGRNATYFMARKIRPGDRVAIYRVRDEK